MLRSTRAAEVNVAIMRAFVQLRRLLGDHAELAAKVVELEQKFANHGERIAAVFEAIRQPRSRRQSRHQATASVSGAVRERSVRVPGC
ncbi:MAG: hypothetical protein ABIP94_16275, partial [Planctomycetota bacterium]